MFTPQTFSPGDLGVICLLVLLEALLSADNALVLAIMVRDLPAEQHKKALTYGLVGAFAFRAVAIALASWVIKLWWLQAIGAVYLLLLIAKHFIRLGSVREARSVQGGFWSTVLAVELTDFAFAVDSVLAGVAMVHAQEKVWVVYVGGIIGVALLRFAAQAFIQVLQRYPSLDHVAYLLVGWAGVKLGFVAAHGLRQSLPGMIGFEIPEMPPVIFWAVLVVIATLGSYVAVRKPSEPSPEKIKPTQS